MPQKELSTIKEQEWIDLNGDSLSIPSLSSTGFPGYHNIFPLSTGRILNFTGREVERPRRRMGLPLVLVCSSPLAPPGQLLVERTIWARTCAHTHAHTHLSPTYHPRGFSYISSQAALQGVLQQGTFPGTTSGTIVSREDHRYNNPCWPQPCPLQLEPDFCPRWGEGNPFKSSCLAWCSVTAQTQRLFPLSSWVLCNAYTLVGNTLALLTLEFFPFKLGDGWSPNWTPAVISRTTSFNS